MVPPSRQRTFRHQDHRHEWKDDAPYMNRRKGVVVMERIKVAVLFGGCSTEYEVSLQSAYSVTTNLNPKKYEAILIGITRQGAWLRYYGPLEKIQNDTWMDGGDCVPCVPAIISPDRKIHGLLEFHDDRTIMTRIDVAFPLLR
jgi:D-alanine---D-serine ligase